MMFRDITLTFVMRSAICYHLHNSKNVKNAHGGVSLLFKSNTPQWAFFAFFKLYKWYQIMQCKSSHMYFQIMLCVQWFVHVVLVTCCLSIVDVKVKLIFQNLSKVSLIKQLLLSISGVGGVTAMEILHEFRRENPKETLTHFR